MADGGVKNILITYEVMGRAKIQRLVQLAQRTNLLVTVDDAVNIAGLSEAAVAAGTTLGILVDINCGQNRCGVDPGEPGVEIGAGGISLTQLGTARYLRV